jgi:RHS repeat-associated protein
MTSTKKIIGSHRLLHTDQGQSSLRATAEKHWSNYCLFGYCKRHIDTDSRSGFNGEIQEQPSGHYLLGNGYRVFNPLLMRFQSPDILSPFAQGGLNTYAYCNAEPLNFTDPSGHAAKNRLVAAAKMQKFEKSIARMPNAQQQQFRATQQKLRSINDRFDQLESQGLLRGKHINSAAPQLSSGKPISFEAYKKTRQKFNFSNDAPSMEPYAFRRADGVLVLETMHFDISAAYFRSKAINFPVGSLDHKASLNKAGLLQHYKKIYILEHYNKQAGDFPNVINRIKRIRSTTPAAVQLPR